MLRQSLKIILRTIFKQRFYSIPLFIGFALSFAIACIITAYVTRELTTDRFHANHERIYRVLMNDPISFEKGIITFHQLPSGLHSFPEVANATHVFYPGKKFISTTHSDHIPEKNYFKEEGILYTDQNFLEIFGFKFLVGNRSNALQEPRQIVLTKEVAVKYFGQSEVLNKVIYINQEPYTITGLIENNVYNSQFRFDFLVSKSSLNKSDFALDYAGVTYVLLHREANVSALKSKMEAEQTSLLPYKHGNPFVTPFDFEPLTSSYNSEVKIPGFLRPVYKKGDLDSLKIFALIALAILLLSMVNYLTFSRSKVAYSLKEHLVKRTFGAPRGFMIRHLITECTVYVTLSFIASVVLIYFMVPIFNSVITTDLSINFFMDAGFLVILFSLAMFILVVLSLFSWIFVSGAFSSVIQSTQVKLSRSGVINTLFVIQLTGTAILVSLALLVFKQASFLKSHPPGYKTQDIIELDLSSVPRSLNPYTLKSTIANLPWIISSTVCHGSPLTGRWSTGFETREGTLEMGLYTGDVDFMRTFDIQLLAGRGFDEKILSDTTAILINEAGSKALELDENFETRNATIRLSSKVIGIVKDFHYASFKESVGPAIIGYRDFKKLDDFGGEKIAIKCSSLSAEKIADLQRIWQKFVPDQPFEYILLEKKYETLHLKEFKQSNLITTTALLCMLVSAFGLVGLSLFLSTKKAKEVAIRKTLGASSGSIVAMFLKQFSVLTLISFALSIPFTWFFSNAWLQQFVYKDNFSFITWVFALLILIAFTVASVYRFIHKTAYRNPAEVLKHE